MRDKFSRAGKRFVKSELVSGSAYLFTGSMIANILAFIFNLFLVRNLAASDYGIYASLLSVITLVGVPAQSLSPVIVRFAAGYFAKNEIDKAAGLYIKMLKLILLITLGLFLCFIFFSVPIKNFLRINSIWYVVLAGADSAVLYLNLINNSYMQSILRFGFLSFVSVAGTVVKLAVGISLVLLGLKVFGALWAIFFMTLASFILGFIPIRFIFRKLESGASDISTREIFSYALPVAFSILFLTSFTSTDVILVKHFFNAHEAGLYGGLSLIGKVIFYFTAPVPVVMFPLIVKRHSLGEGFKNLFYLSLVLVLLPAGAITFIYFLFPSLVINLFLGGKNYSAVSPYLGIFGIYLTIFSLINVCVSFFLSLGRLEIAPLVVSFAILQIVLISLFHATFFQVIGASLVSSSVLFAVLIFYYFRNYASTRELKNAIAFADNPTL